MTNGTGEDPAESMATVVGIDIGGTKTHLRLRGPDVARDKVIPTASWRLREWHADAAELLRLVADLSEGTAIAAMAVGAQIVEAWGEPALASVAVRMLDKVASALPGVAQRALDRTPLGASRAQSKYCWVAGLGKLRQALAERRKLYFAYRAAGEDVRTERVVQPRSLVFRGDHWSLLAWCEVREEYRSFRPERMRDVCVLDERYAPFETSTKEGEL